MTSLRWLWVLAAFALAACGGSTLSDDLTSVDRTTATADGQDAITVTAHVQRGSSAVQGAVVTLTATGSGNTGSQATTDASGSATLTLRSTVAEQKSLTLSTTLGSDHTTRAAFAVVEFVPGPAALTRFDVQPTSNTAGVPFAGPVTLSVFDAQGNRIKSPDLTFTLTLDGDPAPVTGVARSINSSGQYEFSSLSVTRAGSGHHLVAAVGNAPAVTSAPFDTSPESTWGMMDLGTRRRSFVGDGHDQVTGTFKVADHFGNPIPDAAVKISSSDPWDAIAVAASKTGADGTLSFTIRGRVPGKHTISASALGSAVTCNVDVRQRFKLGLAPLIGAFDPATPLADSTRNSPLDASLAVGDLDGDGAPDLVSGARAFGHVAVEFNQGDGTYLPPVEIAPGVAAASVGIVDVNDDQRPDVIVADGKGVITVVLNDGDHAFHVAQTLTPQVDWSGAPVFQYALAFGDVDGDGRLDVLLPEANGIEVLHNGGNGSLSQAPEIPVAGGVQVIAAGDVNEDQHTDLLAATTSGWTVLIGDGAGGFVAGASGTDAEYDARLVEATGDAHLDVVLVSGGGKRVYPGDGSGAFDTSTPAIPFGSGGFDGWAVADVNHDGYPDLAELEYSPSPLAHAWLEITPGSATGFQASYEVWTSQGGMLASADADRDGITDLLVGGELGVELVRGSNVGPIDVPATEPLAHSTYGGLLVDVDGDHVNDRVIRDQSQLLVSKGNGDGTFASVTPVALPVAMGFQGSGDVDHDGAADIVTSPVSSQDNHLYLVRGHGDGTFDAASAIALDRHSALFALADFDGDHRDDLVALLDSPGLQLLLSNGDGTFRPAGTTVIPAEFNSGLCVADFDGDHIPDVAVADVQDAKIAILHGMPGGRLGGIAQQLDVPYTYAYQLETVCGDVDHDGKAELFASLNGQGTEIFKTGTDGKLALVQTLDGSYLYPHALGDFDGDGNEDLITSTKDGFGLYLGDMFGHFTWYGEFAEPQASAVLVGPVDQVPGDDLVLLSGTEQEVLLNQPY